jgi:hypothetical protein
MRAKHRDEPFAPPWDAAQFNEKWKSAAVGRIR